MLLLVIQFLNVYKNSQTTLVFYKEFLIGWLIGWILQQVNPWVTFCWRHYSFADWEKLEKYSCYLFISVSVKGLKVQELILVSFCEEVLWPYILDWWPIFFQEMDYFVGDQSFWFDLSCFLHWRKVLWIQARFLHSNQYVFSLCMALHMSNLVAVLVSVWKSMWPMRRQLSRVSSLLVLLGSFFFLLRWIAFDWACWSPMFLRLFSQ